MPASLYIGLISGTSIDAVDCVLADFSSFPPAIRDVSAIPVPAELRRRILALCEDPTHELELLGRTDVELGELFARGVNETLARNHLNAGDIAAIGSHGQTVRHRPPGPENSTPFTLQIGDPNVICERTGIITVADFRRMDLASGGQGAPLVPAFHREIFQSPGKDRAVLNLGGMANITLLHGDASTPVSAFDTGPGNVLLDYWIGACRGLPYDDHGAWAAQGTVDKNLLGLLMEEEYFRRPPPKSTGRELFNGSWLQRKLDALGCTLEPEDVQATLAAFTTHSVRDALAPLMEQGELIVCGGGASNDHLMASLSHALPGFMVARSTDHGLDADHVESTAFAWMARKNLAGEPIDFTSITGAGHPNIMGGVYRPAQSG